MRTPTATGPTLAEAPWLKAKPLAQVFAALSPGGDDVRVVGGAVRNALSGRAITDIDLATPLLPEVVIARAMSAGLSVHPTGLEHGTVTIVADGMPFEVTTLRRDVETDGRRAVVAFSTDWCEDAARRDFTINALYASPQGEVFDYFQGLEDLAHGHIRFIGDSQARIREDYLRILRFFRFNAQYGLSEMDAAGLAACVSLKEGLARLSAERIGAEFTKLIAAPRASDVVRVMAATHVLPLVIGTSGFPERLARLQQIEHSLAAPADPWARLAVLALQNEYDAAGLARRLRLSNEQAAWLAGSMSQDPGLDPASPELAGRAALYRLGAENFTRSAVVRWATAGEAPDNEAWRIRAALPSRWPIPRLPVRGADIVALGIPSGARIGEILDDFEKWWIAEDFPADPALHQKMLRAIAGKVTQK